MMSPDQQSAGRRDTAAADETARWLDGELRELEQAWRPMEEARLPAGLVDNTLARLRREGLLSQPLRVDWRPRAGAWLGIAAALLVVAGLWQARQRLASPLADALDAQPAWAEGLVVPEHFDSPREELEIRLARVSGLLADEENRRPEEGEAARLRSRLDRLATEMEAF